MEFNSINRVFEKVEKIGRSKCKMIIAEKYPSSKNVFNTWQLRIFLYVPNDYEYNSDGQKIYYFKMKEEFSNSISEDILSLEQLYNRETRNNMLDPTFNKNVGYKNWTGPFTNVQQGKDKKGCKGIPITILSFDDKYGQNKKIRDTCIDSVDSVISLTHFITGTRNAGRKMIKSKKKKGKKSTKRHKKNRRKASKKLKRKDRKSRKH